MYLYYNTFARYCMKGAHVGATCICNYWYDIYFVAVSQEKDIESTQEKQ